MENSMLMSRRIKRGYNVICSVYPDTPDAIERPFDGWTVYKIAPCPKGSKHLDTTRFTMRCSSRPRRHGPHPSGKP